ncbi:MAG: hypothetical protein KGL39_37715 [Patescibacteria group bacterium]|nr:hypothetical protein [Patescibacteria group bacterium]
MSTLAMDIRRVKRVKDLARPAEAECLCGCGSLTRGRFAPGHDAQLRRSLRATVEAGGEAGKVAKQVLKELDWD